MFFLGLHLVFQRFQFHWAKHGWYKLTLNVGIINNKYLIKTQRNVTVKIRVKIWRMKIIFPLQGRVLIGVEDLLEEEIVERNVMKGVNGYIWNKNPFVRVKTKYHNTIRFIPGAVIKNQIFPDSWRFLAEQKVIEIILCTNKKAKRELNEKKLKKWHNIKIKWT